MQEETVLAGCGFDQLLSEAPGRDFSAWSPRFLGNHQAGLMGSGMGLQCCP